MVTVEECALQDLGKVIHCVQHSRNTFKYQEVMFNPFPKAKISEIRTISEKEQHALEDALPEVDEEWDPFDDE